MKTLIKKSIAVLSDTTEKVNYRKTIDSSRVTFEVSLKVPKRIKLLLK